MAHRPFVRIALALCMVQVVALATLLTASGSKSFRIRDDCDPATFNAAVPAPPGAPPTCNPAFDGDTTFAEFIEELTEDQTIGAWRFNPDETRLDRGEATVLESRGGEFHTFTKVAKFGGGIVPDLNLLTGAGDTVPECGTPGVLAEASDTNIYVPDGAILAGPTAGRSAALPRGSKTKWQCCIHPWMTSEIEVR
jgi:hypothetical protein